MTMLESELPRAQGINWTVPEVFRLIALLEE